MTKFFNILKKTPVFGPFLAHFANFGGKNIFLENPALSCTTGFLVSCQNLEKTNDTIPRKCLDRRKDGWKDGRTDGRMGRPYFMGPFWLTLGVRLKENEFAFHFFFSNVVLRYSLIPKNVEKTKIIIVTVNYKKT